MLQLFSYSYLDCSKFGRNLYWFLGCYLSKNFYSYFANIQLMGFTFLNVFSFNLILILSFFYLIVVGLDEELILALLIGIFSYYFYKFVFRSIVVFLELENNGVVLSLVTCFSNYKSFLEELFTFLFLYFKFYTSKVSQIFIVFYLNFVSILVSILNHKINFHLLLVKNTLINLLSFENKLFFVYNLSSFYFLTINRFNSQLLDLKNKVMSVKSAEIKSSYDLKNITWYYYYWPVFFTNFKFNYFFN